VLSFGSPAFAGNLLLLAALAVGGFLCVARPARGLFGFCLLGWSVAIGPMLNLSVWSFPAYDRFEYMALPLLLLALALVVENLLHAALQNYEIWQAKLVVALWAAALAPMALLGAQRGALFSSELAVMLDAAEKAPRAAFAYLGIAQCLKQAWRQAGAEQQPEEQRRLALAAYGAMNRARDCPDYKHFYHNDINMLLDVGQMLLLSGLEDEAQVLLKCVATERRWAAFPEEVEGARKLLAGIEAHRKATGAGPR